MIHFKNVRWTNFLSYGNNFTEINLDTHRATLIVGRNGTGKSTLLDALFFGLYGKPFRPINKPQLINSITQKGTMVEVEFDAGGYSYLVKRGIKPSVFQIWRNGVLLDQEAQSRDQQEMLESSIIKMNLKSFGQVVVLGLANFIPFMRLPAAGRRTIIEDLLDIQVFSVMNTLLRDRVSKLKLDLQSNENEISLTNSRLKIHEEHLLELEANHQEMIEDRQQKIKDCKLEIKKAIENIKSNKKLMSELKEGLEGEQQTNRALRKLGILEPQIEDKARIIEKEIIFYLNSEACPACKQPIEKDFKEKIVKDKQTILDNYNDGLSQLADKKAELDEKLENYTPIHMSLMEKEDVTHRYNMQINSSLSVIKTYDSEIIEFENKHKKSKEEDGIHDKLVNDQKQTEKDRGHLLHEKEILFVASQLLKDGGIKAKSIKQYIPILNKLINRYLQALDFFVEFEIDEEFKETIKSRHRDEFSYESFSQGEKLRIDLSLMFTWRAVSKMRNSATTNLLILDEILDSSLDTTGVEDFIQIIKALTKGTNTFIISHKLDNMEEFDRVIQFEKRDNFSRIAA